MGVRSAKKKIGAPNPYPIKIGAPNQSISASLALPFAQQIMWQHDSGEGTFLLEQLPPPNRFCHV